MLKKNIPDIKVYYIKSSDGVRSSGKTFTKLESYLDSFKGRKFYGVMYGKPPKDNYYTCVAVNPEDEFKPLPLDTMIIPGGLYIQEKVNDWHNHLDKISEVFKRLEKSNTVDRERPSIEFYTSFRELRCLVPIEEK